MSITPLDIQQHSFKNRLFGYDSSAVDQFLEQLADEMEQQNRLILELQEEQLRNQKRLGEYESRERVLNETMLTAQKVAGDLRDAASREAELMLAESRLEGDRLLREADQRRLKISEEIQEIYRQKISFQAGLRSLVEGHLKLLDMDLVNMPDITRSNSLLESSARDEGDEASETQVIEDAQTQQSDPWLS